LTLVDLELKHGQKRARAFIFYRQNNRLSFTCIKNIKKIKISIYFVGVWTLFGRFFFDADFLEALIKLLF